MESIKIKNFKQFLVSEEKTIRYCIIKLNNFKIKTLFVVNNLKEKIIIGSITDGDIRRAFINGFNANDRISKIALKKCFSINELHEIESKKEIFEKYSVFFLPQINLKKRITNIYHLKENDDHKSIKFGNKNNPILLMAGGKGIRLGALTKNTPKPILSIKKITIKNYKQ